MFPKNLSSIGPLGEKFIFYSLLGFLLFYVFKDVSSIFKLCFSRPFNQYLNGVSTLNGEESYLCL